MHKYLIYNINQTLIKTFFGRYGHSGEQSSELSDI